VRRGGGLRRFLRQERRRPGEDRPAQHHFSPCSIDLVVHRFLTVQTPTADEYYLPTKMATP
jgi:hypothetical protein